MEASYQLQLENKRVKCLLCPHHCLLEADETGKCLVRRNEAGILQSEVYGELSAMNLDPVEKKPLYHFHPAGNILSIGAMGCNFKCSCCQNYSISQSSKTDFPRSIKLSGHELIEKAREISGNIGIAFTYNEPTVWFEYMRDIAKDAKLENLATAMVSNAFINTRPLHDLLNFIDAFNIDIKTFDPQKHVAFTGGDLKPVLKALHSIVSHEKHLEITILIVPGISDNEKDFSHMVSWIANELGKDVPLHISRYFPNFKMREQSSDPGILTNMAQIASETLSYVYLGNFPDSDFQNTRCPNCNSLSISRKGYFSKPVGLNARGECTNCAYSIAIR